MDEMDEVVRFEIPGPPRPTQRAKSRAVVSKKTGRAFAQVYTPSETRNEMAVVRQMGADRMGNQPPWDEAAIDFRAMFYFAVPLSFSKRRREDALAGRLLPTKKPDVDNLVKLVTDALKGIVWRDDAQITEMHIWKRYSDRPRTVVEIRAVQAR